MELGKHFCSHGCAFAIHYGGKERNCILGLIGLHHSGKRDTIGGGCKDAPLIKVQEILVIQWLVFFTFFIKGLRKIVKWTQPALVVRSFTRVLMENLLPCQTEDHRGFQIASSKISENAFGIVFTLLSFSVLPLVDGPLEFGGGHLAVGLQFSHHLPQMQGLDESKQHCLWDCLKADEVW